MTTTTYVIVQHNDGWVYRFGEALSETFATRDEAVAAARRATSGHDAVEDITGPEENGHLDEGLEETFPASDPVSATQPTRTGEAGEMNKKD